MRSELILCVAASFLPFLYAQEPARSGNQIFHVPPGWVRSDSPPGTILSPASEPKDSVVLLLSGRQLTGDFRIMFDQMVRSISGNLRTFGGAQPQSRQLPNGIDLLATTIEVQSPNGQRSPRYFMAASVRGRFETLIYSAATTALFQRHWQTVQQFLSTWTFANLINPPAPSPETSTVPEPKPSGSADSDVAPRAAAPTPANRLEGIYSGFKFNYVTVLGVVQRKAVNDYFSFFPDGTVYWGLPQGGLAGFDMTRACQGHIEICGTYEMNGEQLWISLNRGTYRQAGSRTSGGLQIEDRQYKLEGDPSKSAAHELDGVFVRADAQPGEDLARHFIRFTRDGQFVDQGIVTTVIPADISTGNPRFERASGAGTYRLVPYTLILRYQDGYQRQIAVTMQPDDLEKPLISKLLVNTYTLVLRK